jgi:hypothetical protein
LEAISFFDPTLSGRTCQRNGPEDKELVVRGDKHLTIGDDRDDIRMVTAWPSPRRQGRKERV